VSKIDPRGEKFDPNCHQAVQQVENPELPNDTVCDVFQVGYMIADRVLRPAVVAVAKGGPRLTPPDPSVISRKGESVPVGRGGQAGSAGDNDKGGGEQAAGEAGKQTQAGAQPPQQAQQTQSTAQPSQQAQEPGESAQAQQSAAQAGSAGVGVKGDRNA
jgi:hypothetical protein